MKWWLNRDNCRGLTDRDAFRSLSIRSGIWSRGMLALSLAVFPRGKNVMWMDFSTRRSNYTAQGCRGAIKVNPFSRTHDISGEIDIPIPRASIKRHRHDLWTRVPQTHNIPIPYHGTGGGGGLSISQECWTCRVDLLPANPYPIDQQFLKQFFPLHVVRFDDTFLTLWHASS